MVIYNFGNKIAHLGSIGDKFYIILQGNVSVMIPNPDIKDFKKRYEEFQNLRFKGTDKSSEILSNFDLSVRDNRKQTLKIEDQSNKMQEMRLILKNNNDLVSNNTVGQIQDNNSNRKIDQNTYAPSETNVE